MSRRRRQTIELQLGKKSHAIVSREATRGYTFKNIIGSGTSGTVYRATSPNLPDVAIKVQSDRGFEEEADLARRMSELGVGPQLVEAWSAEGVGFLVTDKWDTSLWDYVHDAKRPMRLPSHLVYKLKVLIRRLHDAHIVHGDILEKNILVQVKDSGELANLILTDFGLANTIEKWKETPDFLQTMLDYQKHSDNHTHHYFEDLNIGLRELKRDPRHLDWSLLYYLENY